MGSLISYVWGPSVPDNYDVPDEALGLTLRDKDLVRKSWEMILKKGVRPMGISLFKMYVNIIFLLWIELLTIALIICYRFFELHPHNQLYFATFKDVPIEQLQDNKMLRSHSSNVMHSLTGVIGLLDDPEALVENLLKMGSNHNPRNISKQAFDVRPYKYIIKLLIGITNAQI